jgi:hypothetical protein
MKLSVNLIIQILATIVQVLNFASGMVPAKYQWILAGALSLIQAITGILAHFSNPDGTPATAKVATK